MRVQLGTNRGYSGYRRLTHPKMVACAQDVQDAPASEAPPGVSGAGGEAVDSEDEEVALLEAQLAAARARRAAKKRLAAAAGAQGRAAASSESGASSSGGGGGDCASDDYDSYDCADPDSGLGGGYSSGLDSDVACGSKRQRSATDGREDDKARAPYSNRGRTPAVWAYLAHYGFTPEGVRGGGHHEVPSACFERHARRARAKGATASVPVSIEMLAANIRRSHAWKYVEETDKRQPMGHWEDDNKGKDKDKGKSTSDCAAASAAGPKTGKGACDGTGVSTAAAAAATKATEAAKLDAALVKAALSKEGIGRWDRYYYSFCRRDLEKDGNTWHCRKCGKCADWRVWHCKGCNKCQYGVSIPCEKCQPRRFKRRMEWG